MYVDNMWQVEMPSVTPELAILQKKKKAGVKEKSVFFLMWFYEKSSLEETFEHQQQQSRFSTWGREKSAFQKEDGNTKQYLF